MKQYILQTHLIFYQQIVYILIGTDRNIVCEGTSTHPDQYMHISNYALIILHQGHIHLLLCTQTQHAFTRHIKPYKMYIHIYIFANSCLHSYTVLILEHRCFTGVVNSTPTGKMF